MKIHNQIYMDVSPVINIGFDLHGVLDNYSEQMVPLLKELCDNGCAVHILSGPSKQKVEQELQALGYIPEVHYHYLFSVVDYLKAEKAEMWKDEKNTWWTQDETWWQSKGNYCRTTHCEYLFDNSIRYKDYMPPMTNFRYICNEQDASLMIELLRDVLYGDKK